jgi:acyl-CoA reductase-like NAD-dependent aldehyde dehydrogenase
VQASYHAGQVCVSTQRIYVHADLEHEFLERFTALVAALKVGDPFLADIEVGPLITPHERKPPLKKVALASKVTARSNTGFT